MYIYSQKIVVRFSCQGQIKIADEMPFAILFLTLFGQVTDMHVSWLSCDWLIPFHESVICVRNYFDIEWYSSETWSISS